MRGPPARRLHLTVYRPLVLNLLLDILRTKLGVVFFQLLECFLESLVLLEVGHVFSVFEVDSALPPRLFLRLTLPHGYLFF